MRPDAEELRFDWRRGGAAAIALVAALVLLGMVFLVAFSNDARERALAAERQAYEVALVVRNVSSSISRAEAALGRFVLDEEEDTTGNIYYSQWLLAGHQINQLTRLLRDNPEQRQRVAELQRLYVQRGREFALAARAAAAGQGQGGTAYFYQAGLAETDEQLDRKLDEIADAERLSLRERIAESRIFSARAERLTDYLSYLGIFVGLAAIFLGLVSVQALRQFAFARRLAEDETERAEALEEAVRERTQELW